LKPVMGDLHDLEAMRKGMEGCTHVFHLAASVSMWGPYAEHYRDNVTGTQNVLKCARAANVGCFVHCSSEATMAGGSKLLHNADETWPWPKIDGSVYPYSASKQAAEKVVIAANSSEMATVVVRPRFIWGRGDTTVTKELVKAVKAGHFAWFDGGKYQTSTVHIRNCTEGHICAAIRGKGGESYYLTDGKTSELRAFWDRTFRTQGVTKPITTSIPFWLAFLIAFLLEWAYWLVGKRSSKTTPPLNRQTLRLIGREVTVVDTKARRDIGYQSKVTIDQGMAELEEDYAASLKK